MTPTHAQALIAIHLRNIEAELGCIKMAAEYLAESGGQQ